MEDPLDSWFKSEILIHEPFLMRFLTKVWPRDDEVLDLLQETYARVYKSAKISRPHAPKAFLFSTARHLIADRVRRERIVSITTVAEPDFLDVLVDEISPERKISSRQELARLARAFDRLPRKCREVVWLRRVQELSQREVAQRLGLNEKTVERHIANGGRLLGQYMRGDYLGPGSLTAEAEDPLVEEQQ